MSLLIDYLLIGHGELRIEKLYVSIAMAWYAYYLMTSA